MMIIVSHILEQKVENLANVISRQASKRVELGDSEEKTLIAGLNERTKTNTRCHYAVQPSPDQTD